MLMNQHYILKCLQAHIKQGYILMIAAVLLPTGIHAEENLSPGISGPTATVKGCFQGSALAGSYLPFNKKTIVTRASQEPK